jgi:ribosomal protein S18 acetylase RimI-like enzyme
LTAPVHGANIRSTADGIRELEPAEYPEAARVITDALLHDPGWLAVGPNRAGHRRFVMLRYHRACLRITDSYGRPIYGAFKDDRLVGVAATFAVGRYPPPRHTFLQFVPGFLAGGPGPSIRGLRFSAAMENGHPHHEHVYLWHLAVDPAAQRAGVGRALLARVFEDAAQARAPVWLETANPANVPYYASNGFEEVGRAPVPRGGTIWFMQRPSGATGAA